MASKRLLAMLLLVAMADGEGLREDASECGVAIGRVMERRVVATPEAPHRAVRVAPIFLAATVSG